MKTEIQVLQNLKRVISEQLKDYYAEVDYAELLEEDIDIVIGFPELDNLRKNTTFFLNPDYEEIQDLSMGTDFATLNTTVYIMCKGFKNETLIKKVFGFYTALYALVRNNQTLDDYVDFTAITSMDFFPAVAANTTMTAIETNLTQQWAKCF